MKENTNYNGCVYLLRYTGIDAVKIGMTNDLDAMQRVNAYWTYAPFGLEVICIIQCVEPLKVENEIHKYFRDKRLNGEWFKLSKEDCDFIENKYTDKFTRDLKNDIELEFLRRISPHLFSSHEEEMKRLEDSYSFEKTPFHTEVVILSIKEIINENSFIDVKPIDVQQYMFSNGIKYQSNRIKSMVKTGYKLYKRK